MATRSLEGREALILTQRLREGERALVSDQVGDEAAGSVSLVCDAGAEGTSHRVRDSWDGVVACNAEGQDAGVLTSQSLVTQAAVRVG